MGRVKKNPDQVTGSEVVNVRKSPRKKTAKEYPASVSHPTKRKAKQTTSGPKAKRKSSESALDVEVILESAEDSDSSVDAIARQNSRNEGVSTSKLTNTKDRAPVITEEEILTLDSSSKLASILNNLIGTKQDELFNEYRVDSKERISSLEQELANLRSQLLKKQETIDTLALQIKEAQNSYRSIHPTTLVTPKKGALQMYESPIRTKETSSAMICSADMEGELKTISFTFDILELLTGVRVTNYEEDTAKFYFDIRQTDTSRDADKDTVSIDYRLVIKRKFEQTAEVTYIPVFLKNLRTKATTDEQEQKNKQAREVEARLPDYLRDNLKFPFDTLLQFYSKLVKALNKCGKSR